jgi:hypothetical protein
MMYQQESTFNEGILYHISNKIKSKNIQTEKY